MRAVSVFYIWECEEKDSMAYTEVSNLMESMDNIFVGFISWTYSSLELLLSIGELFVEF